MKVAVIGGGMTGLSIAYRLSQNGIKCSLYEAGPCFGGLAASLKHEGILIDKFYHHFFVHDEDLLGLAGEMGLQDYFTWKTTSTGMYFDSRTYPLSTPLDLLRFKPLSIIERLRMGILVFNSQRKKNDSKIEKISARDWITKNCGKNAYQVMWEPLLRSKFGVFADNISAAWLMSKFTKRGASRTRGGTEKLGYLKGGMARLIFALSEKISKTSTLHTSKAVAKIIVEKGKAKGLMTADGGREDFDIIVSTLSTEATSDLLGDSHDEYKRSLLRIGYLANMTLVLFLEKSISEYYWLNINEPDCPFVGVIEHTKLTGTEEYKGKHILYISKYLDRNDKYFSMGKDAVTENYWPWLSKIFPGFKREDISASLLCRDIYTQPVIEKGYRELIPSVKTPIENFYLVTMAQIYPEDRQVSNSVRNGKAFVLKFISEMKK